MLTRVLLACGLLIALVLVLGVTLTGCGDDGPTEADRPAGVQDPDPIQMESPGIGTGPGS